MAPAFHFAHLEKELPARLREPPARHLELADFRPAAVLIAILKRPDGPTILFTRRTETVQVHKGQIAFPGGAREPGESAHAAALREAEEEVGLDPERVTILGALDDYPTISRYVVTPVVATIATPPQSFRPQLSEVSQSFEVPLARLVDPARQRAEWRDGERLPLGIAPTIVRAIQEHGAEYDRATDRYRIYAFDHVGEPPFASHDPGRLPGNDLIWGVTGHIVAVFLERALGVTVP